MAVPSFSEFEKRIQNVKGSDSYKPHLYDNCFVAADAEKAEENLEQIFDCNLKLFGRLGILLYVR